MRIVIYIRTDIPWYQWTRKDFLKQPLAGKPKAALRAFFRRGLLDVWEEAFSISYLSYRGLIQQIMRSSLQPLVEQGCYIVKGPQELRRFLSEKGEPAKGGWIIPVDDDDTLSPELPGLLSETDPDTPIALWDTIYSRSGKPHYSCRDVFSSNSYALHSNLEPSLNQLSYHWMLGRPDDGWEQANMIARYRKPLGYNNKTVGSLSQILKLTTDKPRKRWGHILRQRAKQEAVRRETGIPWIDPTREQVRVAIAGILQGKHPSTWDM